MLAIYSLVATNMLMKEGSDGIFKSASNAIIAELYSIYEQVQRTTQRLAYSCLVQSETLEYMPAAAAVFNA